jgi:hypothetical protein
VVCGCFDFVEQLFRESFVFSILIGVYPAPSFSFGAIP